MKIANHPFKYYEELGTLRVSCKQLTSLRVVSTSGHTHTHPRVSMESESCAGSCDQTIRILVGHSNSIILTSTPPYFGDIELYIFFQECNDVMSLLCIYLNMYANH